jgi:alpha-beta hydrolase superfamily lysophospholipase
MHEHREVAASERRLLMRDRVQGDARLHDDAFAIVPRDHDLNALVTAARLPAPYIMIGQSVGGPIVGTFAWQRSDS